MSGGGSSTFNKKIAREYESWYETREGRYFDHLEKELILRLLRPKYGESLLEIGCGTGHFLRWFKIFGLRLVGVDNSEAMLTLAKENLNEEIELRLARAEELPFRKDEFDLAVMITTLEFLDEPDKALREALRVTKYRIFLGVLNRYSLLSFKRRIKELCKDSVYQQAKFYSIRELIGLLRDIDSTLDIYWETTGGLFAPKNPFSAFIGFLIKKT